MIGSLVTTFIDNIESDEAISIEVGSGASFVYAEQVDNALRDAGLDSATTDALVGNYEKAQLEALKAGLLLAAFIALAAVLVTRNLRAEKLDREHTDEPET